MAFPRAASAKWVVLNISALKRASNLLRRRLIPLESYLNPGKYGSARKLLGRLHRYRRDTEQFYVFEVEEVLFKVHPSLFRLEIWAPLSNFTQKRYQTPSNKSVLLSETADNFRYFLWDLHAYPYELTQLRHGNTEVAGLIDRGLRIAEMALKHNLTILERSIIDSLRQFTLSSYFNSASSMQYCRLLQVSTQSACGFDLLYVLSRRLTARILQRRKLALDQALVSFVSGDPRLRRIHGAICYRQLIDMEHRLAYPETPPVFPAAMDAERRARFLAAHTSLSALAAQLSSYAPPLPPSDCASHAACERAWADIWMRVAGSTSTAISALGPADVLGKLRAMKIPLKRLVAEDLAISIDCGLAALESVIALREEIIDGMIYHFA